MFLGSEWNRVEIFFWIFGGQVRALFLLNFLLFRRINLESKNTIDGCLGVKKSKTYSTDSKTNNVLTNTYLYVPSPQSGRAENVVGIRIATADRLI